MTNGSKAKGWTGSRIRFYAADGRLVDEVKLPAGNPKRFLKTNAGARFQRPVQVAVLATAHIDGALARREHRRPRCQDLAQLFASTKARITAHRVLNGLGKPAWENSK